MARYVVLLRGINVGGKNKLSMAALKQCLEELGYAGVATYINSGNVVLESAKSAAAIGDGDRDGPAQEVQARQRADQILVLSKARFKAMLSGKPKGFGDEPAKYHSDAIFLMDTKVSEAVKAFDPREGVDALWPGKGVIYHQRLSAQRTRTRLNKMMATPAYKSMTIRNWATTIKLLEMLEG